jgi:16S rRNA (uracil1498-N3)-methyltransferase
MRPRLLFRDLRVGEFTLDEDSSHHLVKVLRAQSGDPLVIFDGQGREGQAVIVRADKTAAAVVVASIEAITRESPLNITVIQALCTGDKMDWVVQKSTELGAARVIPVAADRSVLKLDAPRAAKRREHWQAIAEAASAQCGRTVVPEIAPVISFADVISDWQRQQNPKTGWLLDPFADQSLAEAALTNPLAFMIGPEAGWTDEEEQLAKAAGFVGLRCGPRILRTETAAAVVLTAAAIRAGEF